jgi:hypothetical protein
MRHPQTTVLHKTKRSTQLAYIHHWNGLMPSEFLIQTAKTMYNAPEIVRIGDWLQLWGWPGWKLFLTMNFQKASFLIDDCDIEVEVMLTLSQKERNCLAERLSAFASSVVWKTSHTFIFFWNALIFLQPITASLTTLQKNLQSIPHSDGSVQALILHFRSALQSNSTPIFLFSATTNPICVAVGPSNPAAPFYNSQEAHQFYLNS